MNVIHCGIDEDKVIRVAMKDVEFCDTPFLSALKHEWIPCSERMPEYMTTVLTWDDSTYAVEKRIPYVLNDDGEPIEAEWWVSDDYDGEVETDYYPDLRDGAAIAWMPLPNPWKGANE